MSRPRASGVRPSPAPVRPTDPVELRLARSAVAVVAVLAVPVIAVATLAHGRDGALSAGIGAAVVGGMFLMSGGLLSWAARFGPTALMAAALGGYVLRLVIYALLIVLLRPVEAIHGPTLAVSAAVLLVAALVWEARLVTRSPQLSWVDADADLDPRVVENRDPAGAGAVTAPRGDEERTGP